MYWDKKKIDFKTLEGKVFTEVVVIGNEKIIFKNENEYYEMLHEQDCCEGVTIDSINGNDNPSDFQKEIEVLIGNPILKAEEKSNSENPKRYCYRKDVENATEDDWHEDESHTWTFYTLATVKGFVDIRWYGSSNGYYSETVDVYDMNSFEE